MRLLILVLSIFSLQACEEWQGPYLLNLNTYDVRVGFDTRDSNDLQKIESRKAITNIGIAHKLLYVERKVIDADPLEYNFEVIRTQELERNILVLKAQALYIVPMEKGDELEAGDINLLAIERVEPLD